MNYVIRANRINQMLRMLSYKDRAQTVTLDFSPWADDFGTVSAVTASLESGQAAISNESLASNVKTLVITTSEVGGSMIKLTATAGNNIEPVYLYVFAKDPANIVEDYGLFV